MPTTNLPYPEEFRRDSVDLLRTSAKPLAVTARELGIHPKTLARWRDSVLGVSGVRGGGGAAPDTPDGASREELFEENRRLRRELERVTRQREILKKAASILAEDPQPGMR